MNLGTHTEQFSIVGSMCREIMGDMLNEPVSAVKIKLCDIINDDDPVHMVGTQIIPASVSSTPRSTLHPHLRKLSVIDSFSDSYLGIVVSESRWPSAGGDTAMMVGNAQAYNQNLINHVGEGTPKRPGGIEAYIFAMYNENQKPGAETEKNSGLFFPNQQHVYQINFS